jgi:hypothetical protein
MRTVTSRTRAVTVARLLGAGLLGGGAALLVACGSSGGSLIPSGNAGPLQGDFEAVTRAAQSGNCEATAQEIRKTEQDFGALPATVDAGLRDRLREGIAKLHEDALQACAQPIGQTTATTSTTGTTKTTPPTTPTSTETTPPQTPTSTSTTPGGGTPAPGEEGEPGNGNGDGQGDGEGNGHGNGHGDGHGDGQSGGTGAGEAGSPAGGAGPGAGEGRGGEK